MSHENIDSCFQTRVAWGGAFGFLSSEAPQNFLRGDGFINDEHLFVQWHSLGNYEDIASGLGGGEFLSIKDKEFLGWKEHTGAHAVTDRSTGDIFYNEKAMINYSHFEDVVIKEKWLSISARAGQLPSNNRVAEIKSWQYLYRNAGLLKDANMVDIHAQSISYVYNPVQLPTGTHRPPSVPVLSEYAWERNWWDWIYTIRRRY
jgi:hypothetical protein